MGVDDRRLYNTVETNWKCHGQNKAAVPAKKREAMECKIKQQMGNFLLRVHSWHILHGDVCKPRGNGAFLYSLHAIMWVSSELV